MNKNIKTGNFVFKPRARIIKTIGEELISKDRCKIQLHPLNKFFLTKKAI